MRVERECVSSSGLLGMRESRSMVEDEVVEDWGEAMEGTRYGEMWTSVGSTQYTLEYNTHI